MRPSESRRDNNRRRPSLAAVSKALIGNGFEGNDMAQETVATTPSERHQRRACHRSQKANRQKLHNGSTHPTRNEWDMHIEVHKDDTLALATPNATKMLQH